MPHGRVTRCVVIEKTPRASPDRIIAGSYTSPHGPRDDTSKSGSWRDTSILSGSNTATVDLASRRGHITFYNQPRGSFLVKKTTSLADGARSHRRETTVADHGQIAEWVSTPRHHRSNGNETSTLPLSMTTSSRKPGVSGAEGTPGGSAHSNLTPGGAGPGELHHVRTSPRPRARNQHDSAQPTTRRRDQQGRPPRLRGPDATPLLTTPTRRSTTPTASAHGRQRTRAGRPYPDRAEHGSCFVLARLTARTSCSAQRYSGHRRRPLLVGAGRRKANPNPRAIAHQ